MFYLLNNKKIVVYNNNFIQALIIDIQIQTTILFKKEKNRGLYIDKSGARIRRVQVLNM